MGSYHACHTILSIITSPLFSLLLHGVDNTATPRDERRTGPKRHFQGAPMTTFGVAIACTPKTTPS